MELSAPFSFQDLLNIKTNSDFNALAIETFNFQYDQCDVYAEFVNHLGINIKEVNQLEKIPFLPIEFFKTHEIKSGSFNAETVFTSSRTTSQNTSSHFVKSLKWYEQNFNAIFDNYYDKNLTILALLPSYLEREGSSLVYMAKKLIEQSNSELSGFFLNDFDALNDTIVTLEKTVKPYLLLGVTFGLLDFIDQYQPTINHGIVMETGGMKGRKKEQTRNEVHLALNKAFGSKTIHSEYGMTELMSQAYSDGHGQFTTPNWMKVLIRETTDPFAYSTTRTGGINVLDLANINSCCFIATQDIGKIHNDKFEILGRFDNFDLRGCNLMAL